MGVVDQDTCGDNTKYLLPNLILSTQRICIALTIQYDLI